MRQALRMMSWTGALVFGGGLGLGPPPARAQEYLYGGCLYPAPGSVYQGLGYYTYDYYPAPGYFFPAPGYFYPPGFHYPVLRYSEGAPMGYAPVPRYSFPAPWYGGATLWRRGPPAATNRPGGPRFRGRDRRPYSY